MAQETEREVWVTAKTPADIDIRYQEEPKRQYQVRKTSYATWMEAISVTTALDVLNKPLGWWGMKTGVEGVLSMWEQGKIRPVEGDPKSLAVFGEHAWEVADVDTVVNLFKREKITVNSKRDAAGDRGKSVHDALELWVTDGVMPVANFYPEEERGYVEGLVKFLGDLGTIKSKPQAEIMVGSVEHRFAGRYDLEMVLHDANLVTKLATPSWPGPRGKPEERTVFSGRTLLDLKTPKDVYSSHHLQLSGYECARLECGMPKTEQQLVIRVAPDGTYLAVKNRSSVEGFLSVLAIAREIRVIEGKA